MVRQMHRTEGNQSSADWEEILDLPLEVLHFDVHQPRQELKNIPELAESIESQGLQQPIIVNRWKKIGGVMHYIIFKGARRYQSHCYLVENKHLAYFRTIKTIVETEWYDNQLNMRRKLSQWAENSGRENPTKKETLSFLKELIEDAQKKWHAAGKTGRGSLQLAVAKLCAASGGKSKSWGDQCVALCGLVQEMVDLLDADDKKLRLSIPTALQVCQLPVELQTSIYAESAEYFASGGSKARNAYIQNRVRALKLTRGTKPQGHPINDKRRLHSCTLKLKKISELVMGGRKGEDYYAYINKTLTGMDSEELENLIGELKGGLTRFTELVEKAEAVQRNLPHHRNTAPTPQSALKQITRGVPALKPNRGDDKLDTPCKSTLTEVVQTQKKAAPKESTPEAIKKGKRRLAITGRSSWPSYTDEPDPLTQEKKTERDEKGYVATRNVGKRY